MEAEGARLGWLYICRFSDYEQRRIKILPTTLEFLTLSS